MEDRHLQDGSIRQEHPNWLVLVQDDIRLLRVYSDQIYQQSQSSGWCGSSQPVSGTPNLHG